MKQNIILWISAAVIVFVAGYYKSITSSFYPVSGSFGIEGEKITYKFDKIIRGKGPYTVTIRTDKDDLNGSLQWKPEKSTEWKTEPMHFSNGILYAPIPEQPISTKVLYRVAIEYKGEEMIIPVSKPVVLEYRSRISPAVDGLYYFFFYAGLLFAVRSGLEYFRRNIKVKALSVFTLIFFTLFSFIFSPLRNSYESGFMGDYIPSPDELFKIGEMLYFLVWLGGFVLMFAMKKTRVTILITSAIILIFFLVAGYY